MKWKYINSINVNEGFAELFLYSEIGEEFPATRGDNFAYELRYLLEYAGVREIRIRINSVGGSVVEGIAIFSAIQNAIKSYPHIAINTYNDGIAASIAGVIWAAGKNRYMKDYARLMVHGVSVKDTDLAALSPNDREALVNLQEMLITALANGTGLSEETILELFSNGVDNWFNVEECIAKGFIIAENVENTGVKVDAAEGLTAKAFQNKLTEIINNSKPVLMKKVLAKLGLSEAASEDAAADSVAQLQNKVTAAETAKETAEETAVKEKERADALQAQLDTANETAAESVVTEAINSGKFDKSKKAELIEQAKKDLPAFKNMVSFIPTKAKNALNFLDTEGEETKGIIAKVNNRTLRQLEKEDPKLLTELRNTAKPEYAKLYNAQYGTSKTEADF